LDSYAFDVMLGLAASATIADAPWSTNRQRHRRGLDDT
jgi:hypothetical protein